MSSDLSTNTKTKDKGNNELIEKRRRKKKIRRGILLIIMLLSISITLCLKLSYFNIKNIEIVNNRNIPSEEIIKLSNINKGKNIFYLNLNRSKTNILTNSYILNVEIKRKLPNTINISVEERTAIFYIKKEDKYLIVGKDGIVLEEKQQINNMKLIKLEGFDKDSYKVGQIIDDKDGRKIQLIGEITDLIKSLKDGIPEPSIVNIEDATDIKIFYGNMMIKLGTSSNLKEKYNKAINVMMHNGLQSKKGYIDVSYKGDPVFLVNN